jgi:tetratricopeptide (TPR) repeat protein
VAVALMQKGSVLGKLGRVDEAVAVFEELAARYGGSDDDEVRHEVVRGLLCEGEMLRELGRDAAARAPLERAKALGGEWVEPPVEAMAGLRDRAYALEEEGRYEEALLLVADLVNAWPDGPPDAAVTIVIEGMLRSASLSLRLGPNLETALQMYDEVVRRYGAHERPEVRVLVARSTFDKAYVLGHEGRLDEAIAACTDALEYLGDATDPEGRAGIASTLNWRAHWREAAGHGDEAAADLRALLERFPEGESAEIDGQLASARAALS